MSRRIALPGADELFRSTGDPSPEVPSTRQETLPPAGEASEESGREHDLPASTPQPGDVEDGLQAAATAVRTVARRRPRAVAERRPTGRQRHEEKITVYVSADELMDLEHARLGLRGDFGLSADRGRIVREALAVVLADFEAKGDASILVRRLRGH